MQQDRAALELLELYPNLRRLPEHVLARFIVQREADAYQLHRLVEILGPQTIAASATRHAKRHGGRLMHVSHLRRSYSSRLPRDFYDPRPRDFSIYLFVALGEPSAKIGISGNPLARARTLGPDLFDMEASRIAVGAESREIAVALERAILAATTDLAVSAPAWARHKSGCKEWRTFTAALVETFTKMTRPYRAISATELSKISHRPLMLDLLA